MAARERQRARWKQLDDRKSLRQHGDKNEGDQDDDGDNGAWITCEPSLNVAMMTAMELLF